MNLRMTFSFARLFGVMAKEFTQMRRDRLTFALMIGVPIVQLLLFGYAINSDPRHLPIGILQADNGPVARTIYRGMQNSTYFDFTRQVQSEAEGRWLLATGKVQFIINIPPNFTRDFLRGDKPALLLQADATDPGATGAAIASIASQISSSLGHDLKGALDFLAPSPAPVDVRVQAMYNPEVKTSFNIVPGLLGVILTMTMVMITALAITRERERGTMENLLAMPVRPVEVLLGKIVPYILIGYVQIGVILILAKWLFCVPMLGSIPLLLMAALLFIAGNLAVGITFSTIAKNQLQAMQMTFFFFLPNILLSGFMFPFRGMPDWAQAIGSVFPLTHFLRIVRGILLKGNGPAEIMPEVWPIAVFTFIVIVVSVKRYRQTLD